MRFLVLVRVLDQIPSPAQAQALMLALLERECGFSSHHTASPVVHYVSNTLCSRMLLEVLLCPGRDTLQHGPSWCLSWSYHTPCQGVLTLQWRCLQPELDVLYFHHRKPPTHASKYSPVVLLPKSWLCFATRRSTDEFLYCDVGPSVK